MLEYIWDNWWLIMDTLAREPVEDGLSVLAGYVAFALVFTTLLPPLGLFALVFKRRIHAAVVVGVLVVCAAAFLLTMFQAHEILNAYQHWYTTPLGPSL